MLKSLTQHRLSGLGFLAVIILLVPVFLTNPFQYDMATLVLIYATTVVGLNLLVGYAGQISLGHAGFFGLGAYFSAIMTGTHGWSPIPTLLLGAALVGLLAFIVGRPILRLKGYYLGMATLALGFIIYITLNNEGGLTGGPDGMPVPGLSVFGWELSTFNTYSFLGLEISGSLAWYWLMGVLLVLGCWIAQNLIDSPIGRALRSVHGSEVAASVVGVDTAKFKNLVFVVSAVYASLMGSLYAHFQGFITPDTAGFMESIILVTMVVLGGMGSTLGVIFGAALLTLLPQLLADFHEYEMMMFGLILMLTMIFMPKGFLPTIQAFIRKKLHKKAEDKA